MKNVKKRISRWLLALLSTVMVLASLIGCSSSDVNEALDVAIEVLEVVESMEAEAEMESGAGIEEESSGISESPDKSDLVEIEASSAEEDAESEAENKEETESVGKTEASAENQAETKQEAIDEDGHYTSKEEVALYIHTYGKLPSNFISKKEAEALGWKKEQGEAGQLHIVAPGMSIGGSSFGNYEGLLPEKKGRKYYECDINYVKGNRGAERIVYSNDGLIFYTGDHYESFEQLYPEE